MKHETTIKAIRKDYSKVFCAGYCDLQDIMYTIEPQFYNKGVYGWNCDVYVNYSLDIAITTGYRNMAGKMIPSEIIKKYSDISKEIRKNQFRKPYDDIKAELNQNAENFWKELDSI